MTAPACDWKKSAIKVVAAGIGAAVGGPLGGALGGMLGGVVSEAAKKSVEKLAEKFGEKAAEKIIETGGDFLVEKTDHIEPPQLEGVVREALQLSLRELRGAGKVRDLLRADVCRCFTYYRWRLTWSKSRR